MFKRLLAGVMLIGLLSCSGNVAPIPNKEPLPSAEPTVKTYGLAMDKTYKLYQVSVKPKTKSGDVPKVSNTAINLLSYYFEDADKTNPDVKLQSVFGAMTDNNGVTRVYLKPGTYYISGKYRDDYIFIEWDNVKMDIKADNQMIELNNENATTVTLIN